MSDNDFKSFEVSDEMNKIVASLCEKRSDIFPDVEPDMVECALRIDKVAPASCRDILKIKGIRGSLTALTDKKYLIFGYKSIWRLQTEKKKVLHVAYMLKHIKTPTQDELNKLAEKGKEWEWGKIERPDFVSFRSFARVFGVDWEIEDSVPDLLEDNAISF